LGRGKRLRGISRAARRVSQKTAGSLLRKDRKCPFFSHNRIPPAPSTPRNRFSHPSERELPPGPEKKPEETHRFLRPDWKTKRKFFEGHSCANDFVNQLGRFYLRLGKGKAFIKFLLHFFNIFRIGMNRQYGFALFQKIAHFFP